MSYTIKFPDRDPVEVVPSTAWSGGFNIGRHRIRTACEAGLWRASEWHVKSGTWAWRCGGIPSEREAIQTAARIIFGCPDVECEETLTIGGTAEQSAELQRGLDEAEAARVKISVGSRAPIAIAAQSRFPQAVVIEFVETDFGNVTRKGVEIRNGQAVYRLWQKQAGNDTWVRFAFSEHPIRYDTLTNAFDAISRAMAEKQASEAVTVTDAYRAINDRFPTATIDAQYAAGGWTSEIDLDSTLFKLVRFNGEYSLIFGTESEPLRYSRLTDALDAIGRAMGEAPKEEARAIPKTDTSSAGEDLAQLRAVLLKSERDDAWFEVTRLSGELERVSKDRDVLEQGDKNLRGINDSLRAAIKALEAVLRKRGFAQAIAGEWREPAEAEANRQAVGFLRSEGYVFNASNGPRGQWERGSFRVGDLVWFVGEENGQPKLLPGKVIAQDGPTLFQVGQQSGPLPVVHTRLASELAHRTDKMPSIPPLATETPKPEAERQSFKPGDKVWFKVGDRSAPGIVVGHVNGWVKVRDAEPLERPALEYTCSLLDVVRRGDEDKNVDLPTTPDEFIHHEPKAGKIVAEPDDPNWPYRARVGTTYDPVSPEDKAHEVAVHGAVPERETTTGLDEARAEHIPSWFPRDITAEEVAAGWAVDNTGNLQGVPSNWLRVSMFPEVGWMSPEKHREDYPGPEDADESKPSEAIREMAKGMAFKKDHRYSWDFVGPEEMNEATRMWLDQKFDAEGRRRG